MWVETALKWLGRAASLLAVLGAAAVVFLTGLIVVQVVFRYVFGAPIFGVEDIVRMALAVVVAGSIAYGARHGAHVSVDILQQIASRRLLKYTDVAVKFGGAAIVGLTAVALWQEGECGFRCGDFTDNLDIIHTPFYNLLAVGMAVYALILTFELIALFMAFTHPGPHEKKYSGG